MFRLLLLVIVFAVGFVVGNQSDTDLWGWVKEKASMVREEVSSKAPTTPRSRETALVPRTESPGDLSIYAVQVGSFKDKAQADKLIDELHTDEINAYIARADLKSNSGWYRVYVGEYPDRADAENKLSSLQARYQEAFVQRVE